MSPATRRRRHLAVAGACALAAAAFAFGVAFGDGPRGSASDSADAQAAVSEAWLSAAEGLSPEQLAGQRIVVGFSLCFPGLFGGLPSVGLSI